MMHCDDYIDDPAAPKPLRRFLRYNRWPAITQFRAQQMGIRRPALFATLNAAQKVEDFAGYWDKDGPVMHSRILPAGTRIRVVMASRFGDVGITDKLDTTHGYGVRVPVDALSDFSDEVMP